MALFTSYSDANRTPGTGPNIRYDVTPVYYSGKMSYAGQYDTPIYWIATRSCTRSYSFVGLSRAAAIACANDLRAKHTRAYAKWTARVEDTSSGNAPNVYISQNYIIKCSTSITMANSGGESYAVDVSENDSDVVISREELKSDADFEKVFQLADARDSSSAGSIAVTAAAWKSATSTIEAAFEPFVTNFDKTLVSVEVKSGDTWAAASVSSRYDRKIVFASASNATFRIVYGSGLGAIRSKEWTTNDLATPSLVITADSTATNNYSLMTKVSGGYYFNWSTAFTIVFTSDCAIPGRMTDKAKYTLYIDGFGHTSKYDGGSAVIRSVEYLGNNTYQMSAVFSPDSNGTVTGPCSGVTGSQISLYYDGFKISSNTMSVRPSHYIDIASVSASGVGTSTTFTITFKSSESSSAVLANAKAWQISSTSTPVEITKSSLTYNNTTGAYTFTGHSDAVSVVYGKARAVIYLTLPMLDDPTIQGGWTDCEWTPRTMPKIRATLTAVPANTTVTPNVTTPNTGATFDWDWGDGTVQTNLTASPPAHTYTEAGNYTIVITGDIASISGDVGAPYSNPWLKGAVPYLTSVNVVGSIDFGIRSFTGCTKLTSVVADAITSVGGAAFYSSGTGASPLGTVSLKAATTIAQLAFDGAAYATIDISAANTIGTNALRVVTPETEFTFAKTRSEVQALSGYPWGMISGNIVHCTDGDIII